MTAFNEKNRMIGTAEYNTNFWNVMRGDRYAIDRIQDGKDICTGGFAFPSGADVFAKDCDDLAQWVPENGNGNIPIQDGMNGFTRYVMEMHKLAIFVKLDDDFVHDASFDIEDYLTSRIAKNFAKAKDYGFITGTGDHMSNGILSPTDGAQAGVYTDSITYDDVIRLYFALNDKYRKNAKWLMNNATALTLRLLRDEAGNPLWNYTNNTILGKPVVISNDIPSEEAGETPILFGDFSYYWIIDRSPVNIQMLKEKFVTLDQIGYLALGMPIPLDTQQRDKKASAFGLREITGYVQAHEDEFMEMITKKSRSEVDRSLRDGKQELEQPQSRIHKLDDIIRRLHEDNIKGKISDERFPKMSKNYEAEQKTLECRVRELRSMIATQQESSVNVDIVLAKVRKHTDVRKLTPEIIREFVDRIEVFKPERISGHKVQKMRIMWNCIGKFMPPHPKKNEESA